MTALQLLAAVRRRWYVLTAILVLAVGVAVVLPRQPGVWYSRVDVLFLVPNNPKLIGNALEGENRSLINFTAAIERQVSGNGKQIQLSSPDATLYGAGVRQGYTVTLPREGGQWSPSFDQSVLRIQVIDTTQERTLQIAQDLVTQVESASTITQDQLDIPSSRRIRTEVNSGTPTASFVPGNAKRALVMLGVAGLGVGVAVSLGVDGAILRRRRVPPYSASVLTATS